MNLVVAQNKIPRTKAISGIRHSLKSDFFDTSKIAIELRERERERYIIPVHPTRSLAWWIDGADI